MDQLFLYLYKKETVNTVKHSHCMPSSSEISTFFKAILWAGLDPLVAPLPQTVYTAGFSNVNYCVL